MRLFHHRRCRLDRQADGTGAVDSFIASHPELVGKLELEGIEQPLAADRQFVAATANKFLAAVQEAGRTYRHIAANKDGARFVTEISIDETDAP